MQKIIVSIDRELSIFIFLLWQKSVRSFCLPFVGNFFFKEKVCPIHAYI